MASEMLYPVMPLFLKQIGYSALFIGVLEGIAEAFAGLSKTYFGQMSDLSGKRLPFVRLGYFLSAISKPMLAFFNYTWWIFTARLTDRFGKGIRTGARDALLRDESTPQTRARVFGFHRSLDTVGAILGPALALVYLYYYPDDYRTLFLLAFFPGMIAVACSYFLSEKNHMPSSKKKISFFSMFSYFGDATSEYKRVVTGLIIFALVNSSDVLLLLKMKEEGIHDAAIIGIYIFYNCIYAIFAYPLGIIADKIGIKKTYLIGLILFMSVYLSFAFVNSLAGFMICLAIYGLYAAATEGIAKAWLSNLVDRKETATALGTFSGFQSLAGLIASSVAGFIWFKFGASTSFIFTGTVVFVSFLYLFVMTKTPIHTQ